MINLNDLISAYPPKLQGFKKNILREYLQCKILEIIFNSKHANKLAFLGGTALRIVYNNSRFSEDLDFDNFDLKKEEFVEISEIVKRGLELEGYATEIRQVFKGAFRCYIKFPKILFQEGLSGHREEKILIQIDTAAHNFKYKPQRKIINKFDVLTEILVTPPDILLAQKICAALGRKRAKGRDFYDIIFLLNKAKPNFDYLQAKLKIKNLKELKRVLFKKIKTLDFKQLGRDVGPFLFDSSEAKKLELFGEVLKKL